MNKKNKKLQQFIDSIATIGKSTLPDDDALIYYSKIDGSYLTRVGMEDNLKFLLERGVTEQIQDGYGEPKTACIGFNPIEQKWYGWSHRAIFGFGIGSECKQGQTHFQPSNKKEFAQACLNFWGNDTYSVGDDKVTFTEGRGHKGNIVNGVTVTYTYNNQVPNISLRNTKYNYFCPFPEKWGKGKWIAKTLNDAKQMAIDFAMGVA